MKRPMTALFLSTLCLAATHAAADESGGAERDWTDLSATDGAGLYAAKCAMCHDENGMGTFILQRRLSPERVDLEARDDLQPQFIRNTVRDGLGLMFPMSRAEVSDAQLDRIVRYLSEEE